MERTKTYRQRGQATMEIAAALIAIVFLVMGFYTLGGIGITSIKSLILTRHAAEMKAEGATGGSSTSRQLAGWEYTRMRQKRANGEEVVIQIPFLAGDEDVVTTHSAATDYLEAESASLSRSPDRAKHPGNANYRFLGYRQTPDNNAPGAVYSGNSSELAMLQFHAAELPENDMKGNRNEQNYLFRNMADSESFKRRFSESGWFDTRGIDIREWPSSTFAWPAFGSRRGLSYDSSNDRGSVEITAGGTDRSGN